MMNNFSLKYGPSTADDPNIGNSERDRGLSNKKGNRRSFSHSESIWRRLNIKTSMLAATLILVQHVLMVRAADLSVSSYVAVDPPRVGDASILKVIELQYENNWGDYTRMQAGDCILVKFDYILSY